MLILIPTQRSHSLIHTCPKTNLWKGGNESILLADRTLARQLHCTYFVLSKEQEILSNKWSMHILPPNLLLNALLSLSHVFLCYQSFKLGLALFSEPEPLAIALIVAYISFIYSQLLRFRSIEPTCTALIQTRQNKRAT